MWTKEQKERAKYTRIHNRNKNRNRNIERNQAIRYFKLAIIEEVAKVKEDDYEENITLNKTLNNGRKYALLFIRKEVIKKITYVYKGNKAKLRVVFREYMKGTYNYVIDDIMNDIYDGINKKYVNKYNVDITYLNKLINIHRNMNKFADRVLTEKQFDKLQLCIKREYFKESSVKDYFISDNDPIIDNFMIELYNEAKIKINDRTYWSKVIDGTSMLIY